LIIIAGISNFEFDLDERKDFRKGKAQRKLINVERKEYKKLVWLVVQLVRRGALRRSILLASFPPSRFSDLSWILFAASRRLFSHSLFRAGSFLPHAGHEAASTGGKHEEARRSEGVLFKRAQSQEPAELAKALETLLYRAA